MIIRVNNKEYSFDGYVIPLNSVQRLAEKMYQQGRDDAIDECIAEINRLNLEFAYPHTICNILEMLKEQKNDDRDIY